MTVLHVPASVRGRVLLRVPGSASGQGPGTGGRGPGPPPSSSLRLGGGAWPPVPGPQPLDPGPRRSGASLLIGFHGYAEGAEAMLDRLGTIPGLDDWVLASIQALHPFYRRRTGEVVASWMTRQDRELAIEDNVAYVRQALRELRAARPRNVVLAGFSQGVAMAYRAAADDGGCGGLIVLGGDVPPELSDEALAQLPPILLGRGESDQGYPAEQLERDLERLRRAGATVEAAVFEGGHEWTPEFAHRCSAWLESLPAAGDRGPGAGGQA